MGACVSSQATSSEAANGLSRAGLKLIAAAQNGLPRSLEAHLDLGASVDIANAYGVTALMAAAKSGHSDCLEILIGRGATVNRVDHGGWTALIYASSNGQARCLEVLINHGAFVDIVDNDSWSALMVAAKMGHAHCLEILISHGASLTRGSKDGWTALLLAASHGHHPYKKAMLNLQAGGATGGVATNVGELWFENDATVIADQEEDCRCMEILIRGGSTKAIPLPKYDALCKEALIQAAEKLRCLELVDAPQVASTTPQPLDVCPPAISMLPATVLILEDPGAQTPLEQEQRDALAPTTTPSPTSVHHMWAIDYSEFQINELLGSGAFCKVYSATWHGRGGSSEVAVKIFNFEQGEDFSESLVTKIQKEATLLASIRHPHVVPFLGVCATPPCIVTEKCSRGSLFGLLRRAKNDAVLAAMFTWDRRLQIALDAAAGMAHLHQRSPQVLHRDLKSPNLLVDSGWRVKVSDLGLGRLVEEATAEMTAGSTASNMNPRWLAAEVIESGKWLPSSDVYSFGVVLWELRTWELPWSHLNNNMYMIYSAVVGGKELPTPPQTHCPGPAPAAPETFDTYTNLISRCTDRNSQNRPTFQALLSDLARMLAVERATQPPPTPSTLAAAVAMPASSSAAAFATFSDSNASAMCVICMERACSVVLVHVQDKEMHRCCCARCATDLESAGQPCPICRRPFEIMKLF